MKKQRFCCISYAKQDSAADQDYLNRKMKAQFKSADRKKAKYTVIIGEDELKNETVAVKNMATGEQQGYTDE